MCTPSLSSPIPLTQSSLIRVLYIIILEPDWYIYIRQRTPRRHLIKDSFLLSDSIPCEPLLYLIGV